MLVRIIQLFERQRRTAGSRKICELLKQQQVVTSRKRVARLMRQQGLYAQRGKSFKVSTTDSNHNLPVAPNWLDRAFDVPAPNRVWAADITYIRTAQGWLYLAVVVDLYSRRVVGWALKPTLHRSLALEALRMALERRKPAAGLLHHSDQGRQYASADYQALLEKHACVCSMSRKANCWDNAPVESFFAQLKTESVYLNRYTNHKEARSDIFHYIEVHYNVNRPHSKNNYLSPVAFEKRFLTQVTE